MIWEVIQILNINELDINWLKPYDIKLILEFISILELENIESIDTNIITQLIIDAEDTSLLQKLSDEKKAEIYQIAEFQ